MSVTTWGHGGLRCRVPGDTRTGEAFCAIEPDGWKKGGKWIPVLWDGAPDLVCVRAELLEYKYSWETNWKREP